jgi:hypothetical protein
MTSVSTILVFVFEISYFYKITRVYKIIRRFVVSFNFFWQIVITLILRIKDFSMHVHFKIDLERSERSDSVIKNKY